MRPRHTQHSFNAFPVYSCAFLSPNQLVLGGGGGASASGIKNKLRLYNICDDRSIELKDEFELEKGEDVPMSMAVHTESGNIICGVNSTLEKLEKGENENCRAFTVSKDKIKLLATKRTLSGADLDDYQKVTVLSPDGSMLAVAGARDLTLLAYPSLVPLAEPIHTDKEIYDATFCKNSLILATTHNLFVYSLPDVSSTTSSSPPPSPKKTRKRAKVAASTSTAKVQSLHLEKKVDLPSSTGEGSTFRVARFHPLYEDTLYTVVNVVSPRTKKSKTVTRQAYVCKWNTNTWTVEKSRKVGDRSLTCFDISIDGRFLGFGSSDLSIGMLDAKTLAPLSTILKAYELPPTTIKFDPNTTLLVAGSADNTIRIMSIPSTVGGSSWSVIIFIFLALVFVLVAIAAKQYNLQF
ncbi:unnamed protein product [Cyclocybe aegerita]|uniref:WD40 repeat-like protein n=1 Tax=Cyclocybe aegerita TaxID=1973307 RepID=A0A8S0XKL9_CYCAE|nr:unnamed protein product [Cyclocybe aegerita]